MLDLLYTQRSTAKRSIRQFESLVAVLTQRTGPELLFVYDTQTSPTLTDDHTTCITLREFISYNLSSYDGLLIGFNVLDVLRPDLVSKGPNFFPIERVFEEYGETQSLYRTMSNLSIEVMRYIRETGSVSPDQRLAIESKAFQLALPGMLFERECAGLVAIFHEGEPNRYIARKTCQYIYLNEENKFSIPENMLLANSRNWIVGLEELQSIFPNPNLISSRFVDLRLVMEGMNKSAELQSTRQALARCFYNRAPTRAQDQKTAWSLAVEYWLAQMECEDLLAICPNGDFHEFLQTGDSIRIYRNLDGKSREDPGHLGSNLSLREIQSIHIPEPYREIMFTFPGIDQYFPYARKEQQFDLVKVLDKAGQRYSLARSLWLLSHDILTNVVVPSLYPGESRKILLDACTRACLIYNLSDPWGWRQGRWQIYLKSIYQTRNLILSQASYLESMNDDGDTLEKYYEGVKLWYGCATSSVVRKNLEELLEKLNEFQREAHSNPHMAERFSTELAQSNSLRITVEILLNRIANINAVQLDEFDLNIFSLRENIPNILRHVTDMEKPVPLVSLLSKQAAMQLCDIRQKRQNLYTQERNIQRLIDQLQKLRAELEVEKRQFFIPLHEQNAMTYAYDQEIQTISTLIQEIESSAKISVTLKNTWVDIHRPVNLIFEINNRGRVEARMVEIILDHPRGYQLLDMSPIRQIAALNPDHPMLIDYHIQPDKVGAEVRLEYSFNDRSGQRHRDTWITYLNVRSLDSRPFSVKVNRYQFGRPIQDISEFYGRRTELQNIVSLLKAGGKQNILLRGPRRMGKTSCLYMIQSVISDRSARKFFKIPESWDDDLDRVFPVFLSLHSYSMQTGEEAINQFFRTLLDRIGKCLQIGTGPMNEIVHRYESERDAIGSVNAALEQVRVMLDPHPNRRIAVLLDEYDEVYQSGSGVFDRHLREFVSSEQRLTWIIASTMALYNEVKTISSPWFNVFSIIELNRLTDEAAQELVEEPTEEEDIIWQSDAVLSLLAETGRHPFFTQLFCASVISYLNKEKTNYVLRDMIFSIADEIVNEYETANDHLEYFWKETSGIGQLILLILDDHDQPLKRDEIRKRMQQELEIKFGKLPRQLIEDDGEKFEWQELEFRNQIDWIGDITNAVTQDSQKRYSFTVPLFQRWLRRKRQFQDLKADTLMEIAREMENDGIHLS